MQVTARNSQTFVIIPLQALLNLRIEEEREVIRHELPIGDLARSLSKFLHTKSKHTIDIAPLLIIASDVTMAEGVLIKFMVMTLHDVVSQPFGHRYRILCL